MSRALSFLPAARLEMIEAHDWYEARALGLGLAFQNEVGRQIGRILDTPEQFPIMLADIRRVRLRRFPYSLFFRAVGDDVFVIACFHAGRDPKIWRERL